MRKNVLLIVIFFLIANILYSQSYQDAFTKFLSKKDLKNASVSLYMQNIKTKEVIFKNNENIAVIPASIFKIFPTSIALDLFGPSHKFKTEIAYSGSIDTVNKILNGNIYIIGGGDPCLGSNDYRYYYETNNKNVIEQWADEIVKLGIKKINGQVISDISYFGVKDIPNRWQWQDIENHYGNSGSALNYADNTYFIYFETSAGDDAPTRVKSVYPKSLDIEFDNEVVTSRYTGDEAYIYKGKTEKQKKIKGTLPPNQQNFVIRGSFPETEIYLANELINKLKKLSVEIDKEAVLITSDDKQKKKIIKTTYSPDLQTIITKTNQKSNNMYAQVLSYHIEKKMGIPYSKVVENYFTSHSISKDGLYVDDACGLSRVNTLTAKTMSDYLSYLYTTYSAKDNFIKSLPVGGISGTLKSMSINSNIKVIAKSGSMFRVASYSGYIIDNKKNEYVFCFVVNNFNCSYYMIKHYYEELFNNIANVE